MAKYTGDANLISGAAAAYRNYDNAPGMYDGLDKIGKSAQEALKVIKAEKAKAELEREAEEKKKTDQDAAWYKAAGGAYEKAGGFQKDVEYKSTVSALNDLQPRWVAAMNGGTAEEKAAVSLEYNNIRDEISDHKAFREEITDPEYGLSDALSNSGVVGGNDARDKTFLTALIAEEYEVSNNDEGEKVYTIDGVSKTMSEIKDMAVLKDAVPFTAYEQTRDKRGGAKKFDRQGTEFDIRTNVVPKDFNKLRAFVSDAGHGSGENLADLLRKDKKGITSEIDKTLFDANGDDKISDDEFEQFIQAVVDPYHATWKNDDGTHDKNRWQKHTTNIAIERLANGVENTHGENYPATASSGSGDGFQYDFDDQESDDGGGDNAGGQDFLDAFFGPEADEENAVDKLKRKYKGIDIYSPFGNPYEKIFVDGDPFFLRGADGKTPEQEKQRLREKLDSINNAPTFVPQEEAGNVEQEETSNAKQEEQVVETKQSPAAAKTWRSNKKINSASVDQFNIKGSAGKGRANIFKNNKAINVKVAGGMATVQGVRADGDKLVVDIEAPFNMGGEKTMGEFSKSGGGFKFNPNKEVYDKLKGDDKKDFDAFVLAIETDPAFAMEIMKSVQGENDFNPSDYK